MQNFTNSNPNFWSNNLFTSINSPFIGGNVPSEQCQPIYPIVDPNSFNFFYYQPSFQNYSFQQPNRDFLPACQDHKQMYSDAVFPFQTESFAGNWRSQISNHQLQEKKQKKTSFSTTSQLLSARICKAEPSQFFMEASLKNRKNSKINQQIYQHSQFQKQQQNIFSEQTLNDIGLITQGLIRHSLENQELTKERQANFKRETEQKFNQILGKQYKQKFSKVVSEIMEKLSKKLLKSHKTKEQMTKYIFRKIYNPKNRPENFDTQQWEQIIQRHHVKLAKYKSMNNQYKQEEFKQRSFQMLFERFGEQMNENFQQENRQRILQLSQVLIRCIASRNTEQLIMYRKMPWTEKIKEAVKNLYFSMKDEYLSRQQGSHLAQQSFAKKRKNKRVAKQKNKINKQSEDGCQ